MAGRVPIGFALTKAGDYVVTWFSDGSAQYRPVVSKKGRAKTLPVIAKESPAPPWNPDDFQTFMPFGKTTPPNGSEDEKKPE